MATLPQAVAGNTAAFDAARSARALVLATGAMAVCFAVWLMFAIFGVALQKELGFSQSAFGLLVATPILTGSLLRVPVGVAADLYGGRKVYTVLMLVVAACAFVLPYARTYAALLLIALGLGLAGTSFAVGSVYVCTWYPKERLGTVLGIFGVGNAGAALTSIGAPYLLAVMDWREAANVYGLTMLATALAFWFAAQEDPVTQARRASGAKPPSLTERLQPLGEVRVWRFSLYYFLVFGGFIALTSWLPRYYVGAHGLDMQTAGWLAASFTLGATVLRAFGGMLADRFGARTMMYISFSGALVGLFLLSYPNTRYIVEGVRGPIEFTIAPTVTERVMVLFATGFAMTLGMAAVFKHIPTYYPNHVGSVGGLVGTIGGLGGFFLPIAFGLMNDIVGIWTSCFMLLYGIAGVNLLWMHFAIRRMERAHFPQLRTETDLPEIMKAGATAGAARDAARP